MQNTATRRRVLGVFGAGIVGLSGCVSDDSSMTEQDDSDGGTTDSGTNGESGGSGSTQTVSIGVLQPRAGDLKYYGDQSLWGFLSGLAYKGETEPPTDASSGEVTITADDTEYRLLIRDTEFSADTAQTAATNLVENEDVDLLAGCASSAVASRVVTTVVNQAQVPIMLGPAASADITSNAETCSDLVYRASENTAMDARSGGKYVARETDVSNVYLFGADYSFGRAVVNNYRDVLEAEGVDIVGERFVEQGYAEWEGLLDNAEEAGAEGVVGGFTVATLPAMFNAFLSGEYSYRVFGGFATRITNNVVGGTMQSVLGEPLTEEKIRESRLGPFTTRYHWNQYDNPINDAFVESYTDAYGVVPDLFTAGTFTGASAIHQAIQESGSTEGADIANALKGMTVTDTPKGENGYTFQEYNNQARSAMTVANPIPTTDEWADNWGAAIMPGEPLARISQDETTIPQDSDQMGCSL
ncbi:amino acid/amide ABC transporter substrate-binding protein, HAAT family [Haloarcula vallismortis]|uniref:Branched chain amino acid ABC transporter branched chain amino acid-binding protein n=2 Tax=Haloarcula vallismortis TaxID=28442 RepID=M0JD91_HALVA|nr:ABC transporter substrate-binding protein [Haloarcula vallismortis]EMA07087.1 branched chain amino acid ABC transporter branched chain amino acid-binding protein [Haloarcula vallismortis ATCC 29715]SDW57026.1 amino acid/amide ABC transporter substrate-binding protein, HAAT family [Haloarcula vallismortis]